MYQVYTYENGIKQAISEWYNLELAINERNELEAAGFSAGIERG